MLKSLVRWHVLVLHTYFSVLSVWKCNYRNLFLWKDANVTTDCTLLSLVQLKVCDEAYETIGLTLKGLQMHAILQSLYFKQILYFVCVSVKVCKYIHKYVRLFAGGHFDIHVCFSHVWMRDVCVCVRLRYKSLFLCICLDKHVYVLKHICPCDSVRLSFTEVGEEIAKFLGK